MSVGNAPSDETLRRLRKVGMGILLAAIFVPFDLVVVMALFGAGVYTCMKALVYFRQRAAL